MSDAGWGPERVKALKAARKWTWQDMAVAVGVAWTTAYRWGAGDSTPSPLAAEKLTLLEREVSP